MMKYSTFIKTEFQVSQSCMAITTLIVSPKLKLYYQDYIRLSVISVPKGTGFSGFKDVKL